MTIPKPAAAPSTAVALGVLLAVCSLWAIVRLWVFRDSVAPITFVLPMLLVIWTRRRWHLAAMMLLFVALAVVKIFHLLPLTIVDQQERAILFGVTLFNIGMGGIVIHYILRMRERLEEQNRLIAEQHAEVEQQAEELAQQNEEIKAQAEELTQQTEEMESQADELEHQNAELQEANSALAGRESLLRVLVDAVRPSDPHERPLDAVCEAVVSLMDPSVQGAAILEIDEQSLVCRGRGGAMEIPLRWPIDGSLAGLVAQEARTAYVDEVAQRPDLAAPAGLTQNFGSMIASPLRIEGRVVGAIVLLRSSPGHWSRGQFRFVEWLAIEVGLAMETITYRRNLRERTAEVESANRKKDEFLAMLSHELRTPLTPVLAAAGALRDDPRLPDDVRDDLAMVGRNIAVQSRLIDDLLDLARLGKGKLLLHPQELDLKQVLHEAARIVAADLDAKELTLELAIDLPDQHAINGDGARLQQVIWNLLRNAIKFSPVGSRIRLTAHATDSTNRRARVEVIDHGAGIDPSDLNRIFMPFEQVSLGAGRSDGQGLGLGLCIARAIVELHGGVIRAESAGRGQGASFIVELPLIAATVRSGASHRETPVPMGASSDAPRRILFVEDHEDTARLMVRYLGSLGYAVQHAADTAAAVRSASTGEFDLIISDLGLPDGSGLDLMRRLRDRHPTLTGICLSGFGMESDVVATREAGFAEHLTKPIELPQLRAAIQRVLAIANG